MIDEHDDEQHDAHVIDYMIVEDDKRATAYYDELVANGTLKREAEAHEEAMYAQTLPDGDDDQ